MKLFSTPPVLSGKKNKKRKKLLKAQRKALKRADHPFESDKAADCRGVVLSNRAYLSVLSEVYSRDPLETGGIFFGNVKNGVWYVAEASDPGVYTLPRTLTTRWIITTTTTFTRCFRAYISTGCAFWGFGTATPARLTRFQATTTAQITALPRSSETVRFRCSSISTPLRA